MPLNDDITPTPPPTHLERRPERADPYEPPSPVEIVAQPTRLRQRPRHRRERGAVNGGGGVGNAG